MIIKEIENLKEKLNAMIISDNVDYNEILLVSQKLDVLIVKYLRETCKQRCKYSGV